MQGETSRAGLPTVFIRLTGCPLRCGYCDTAYAFHGGSSMSIAAVLEQVAQYAPGYVTVTGGEPLAQKNAPLLLTALCDASYDVSLETSGALDTGIRVVAPPNTSIVMAAKAACAKPSSNRKTANRVRFGLSHSVFISHPF